MTVAAVVGGTKTAAAQSAPQPFQALVNFQNENFATPSGALADFGQPFGARTGPNQGDTLRYGWVSPETGEPVDLAGASDGAGRNRTNTGQSDPLLVTLIHMDYPVSSQYPSGRYPHGSWEMAVPSGSYEVTVAVGDAGQDEAVHAINVEGSEAVYAFESAGSAGGDARHTTTTVQVGVEDGRLTINQAGGTNTKINYVDINRIQTPRPYAYAVSPANRSSGAFRDGTVSTNLYAPGVGVGVDIQSLDGNVHLYRIQSDGSNGAEVPGQVGSTGGNDAITYSPNDVLEANAEYRFVIDGGSGGVQSESGDDFLPFSSVYTTGAQVEVGVGGDEFSPVGGTVSFEPVDLGIDGIYFSTLQMGPDGKLYGLAIGGKIYRYGINTDGTLSGEEELVGVSGGGPRVPIGLVFDEDATANNLVAWVTHASYGGLDGQSVENDRWGSKVTRLSGPDLETANDVFVNLPRSEKDHLTNSIAYGPDLDGTGEKEDLYFLQGSNLAAGAPDNSWGTRPETKLTAAVLTFDEDAVWQQVQQSGPIDVMTDEAWPSGTDTRTGDYDPFAPGAPLKVYATGLRNAYDLVWHSNDNLYVPTNGTAAGGETPEFDPQDPPAGLDCSYVRADGRSAGSLPAADGSVDEGYTHEKQRDFVFRVEEGGYYGHPNPSRCEWVLNIGNPSADPNEPGEGQNGSRYPAGTQPDPNYRGYPNFTSGPQDMGGSIWDLGFNKSPNGVLEYQSDSFDGMLKGRVLFVRFSGNNDIYTVQVDRNSGAFVGAQPGNAVEGFNGANGSPYDDPIEITENPATGDLYLAQYDRGGGNQKLFLLRPSDRTGGDPSDDEFPLLATSANELIFSARDNPGVTQSKTVTVTNDGTDAVSVSGVSLSGPNADEFSVAPQTATLGAGTSKEFTVTFDPTDDANETRTLSADLTFESGSADNAMVGLFALSIGDYEGSNEPPLSDVVAALGYNLDVGWSGLGSSTAATERGDESYVPFFEKADPGEPVTITPVARYSPAEELPFGWYPAGGGATPPLNQIGTLAGGKPAHQTLFPPLSSGAPSFDPGAESFGIYTQSPLFNHVRYTKDELNGGIARATRIYPLDAGGATDRSGKSNADRYLIGFEDASNGDYQDYVFVLSNVTPAGSAPSPQPGLAEVPLRINVGGEVVDETSYGSFGGDNTDYLTGATQTGSKNFDVAGTADDDLYLSYRYASSGGSFGFDIPLEDGSYDVTLHFVEPFFRASGGGGGGTGQRVFSVDVENGQGSLQDYDLNAVAPGGTAITERFENLAVDDGALNIDFASQVNNAIISAVEVTAAEPPVQENYVMQVGTGWELVGLPLSPSGGASAGELFSGLSVTGGPFGFAGGQYTELGGGTPLEAGEGYWVRFADGGEQPVEGQPVGSVELSLEAGWNLVSGPSCDVALSEATGDPGVLIGGTLTGYDGGAYTTDVQTLEQGEGYWVRASEAGTVSFACGGTSQQSAAALAATSSSSAGQQAKAKTAGAKAALEAQAAREATAGFDRLVVGDAAGRSRTLYFGSQLADDGPPRVAFGLPALPPGGGFDARFEDNSRLVESASSASTRGEEEGVLSSTGAQEVRLQASSYPLEVTIRPAAAAANSDGGAGSSSAQLKGGGAGAGSGGGGGTQVTYLVEELTAGGQVVATHELVAGESSGSNASGNASSAEGGGSEEALRLEVSDESVTRLRVERRSVALPEGFAVAGNYPNPVRGGGATTVELDLPEAAEVTLEVYDMLGRRVMQVGPERLSAGPGRTLEVPVGSLSSGVYLYRARARLEGSGGGSGSETTATDTGKFTVVR